MIVTVLGFPRGGTSLAASILQALGVHLGRKLLPADDANADGYFEDEHLLDFHRAVGAPTDDARLHLRLPAETPKLARGRRARYADTVRRANAAYPRWGFKDPRFVYLFDELSPSLKPDLRLVFTRRDSTCVARSLARVTDFTTEEINAIVGDYATKLNAVEARVRDEKIPFVAYSYDRLVDAPSDVVPEIAKLLDVEPTDEAMRRVKPWLRRFSP